MLATASPEIREKIFRRALRIFLGLAALGLGGHLALLFWAKHEFTPVESLVAIHVRMLTNGQGLYYDFSHYPFTVSAYGPLFYALSGLLHSMGVRVYLSGRGISFTALLVSLWLCWKILGYVTSNRYARTTGVLLAASTSNILMWGTVGQVDMLGCCLALAGFTLFLRYRESGMPSHIVWAGVCVILAAFTKQTFAAAGVTIALFLVFRNKRAALVWIASIIAASVVIALAINTFLYPNFLTSVLRTQMNPFSVDKLEDHLKFFVLTCAGLIIATAVGLKSISDRTGPVFVYGGLALLVFVGTAPKVGSDLNYQMESMILLSLCAACALDQTNFFAIVFSGRQATITMLQMPLLLHLCLNLVLTGRNLLVRGVLEPARREETAALKQYVEREGRLYCEHYDSLVHYRGSIEVEPFPYALLVKAGMIDPGPVLKDLETRKFQTLVLGENLFEGNEAAAGPDSLPRYPAHVAAIRANYHLVAKISGPYGLYVYEPKIITASAKP